MESSSDEKVAAADDTETATEAPEDATKEDNNDSMDSMVSIHLVYLVSHYVLFDWNNSQYESWFHVCVHCMCRRKRSLIFR